MQALTEPVDRDIQAGRIMQTYQVVFWGDDVPGGVPATRFVYVTITPDKTTEEIEAELAAGVQQRANELVDGEARVGVDDEAAAAPPREVAARRKRARVERIMDVGSLRVFPQKPR